MSLGLVAVYPCTSKAPEAFRWLEAAPGANEASADFDKSILILIAEVKLLDLFLAGIKVEVVRG